MGRSPPLSGEPSSAPATGSDGGGEVSRGRSSRPGRRMKGRRKQGAVWSNSMSVPASRPLRRGAAEGPAPRRAWRRRNRRWGVRGATSARGVGPATSLDARPDGTGGERGQPEPCLQACEGEQGGAGSGRDDRQRPWALARRSQGHGWRNWCEAGHDRSRGWRSPSRAAGCGNWASRRWSSRPCWVSCSRSSTRRSRRRPGRSAHGALAQAGKHVAAGYGIVVDLDLEKFFDRINHDILMARLARRIGDRRLLRIVRRFLEAGMMREGVCTRRYEGTPQGGPLSPLLANLLLDDLDEAEGLFRRRFPRGANRRIRAFAARK